MKITDRTIISIAVCACLSIFLIIANVLWVDNIPSIPIKNIVSSIISTIATVLLAGVLWEIIAKKHFTTYLLDQVKISENIAKSGIDTVYVDFKDINWNKEFKDTRSFTAVFVYAYSWRSSNERAIKEYVKKSKHTMTVIVPDPRNNDAMSDLDRRFNFENGETKKRVEDCIKFYCDLNSPDVHVHVYKGTLQSSYYLMDKTGIMSFFSHSKEKGSVPAIRAIKGGEMYEYISNDIESLLRWSDEVESITVEITNGVRKTTIKVVKR